MPLSQAIPTDGPHRKTLSSRPSRFWLPVLFLASIACGLPSSSRQPELNVLLITIDTLRADHLSSYGYHRDTSPALDHLASEGVLFENAIVQQGATWPSVTSIMTSMYPGTHGVRENGMRLDASKRTLPEILQGEDYLTAAFITNMGTAPNRGFDTKRSFGRAGGGDDGATSAARRWLKNHSSSRFFLWLHLLAPHVNYAPPPPFDKLFDNGYQGNLSGSRPDLVPITLSQKQLSSLEVGYIRSLYDGEVAYVDKNVDLVLRELEGLDLDETTLVVVTSDHGEELYDRNQYFFHSLSIYDSVLRVPLILRLPEVILANRRVPQVVQSIDIAPTILDLLGIAMPESFQGQSFSKMLLSDHDDGVLATYAFSERGATVASVRSNRWRYVFNPEEEALGLGRGVESDYSYRIEREELYDLQADPDETMNIIHEHPELGEKLRRLLVEWREETEVESHRDQEFDQATLDELRALGYIQ